MRVTIIPSDGFVSVDGVGYQDLDLSSVDSSIHAVQFNGANGWIEYVDAPDGKPENEPINSIAAFQPAIDVWQQAYDEAHKPPMPPTPEQIKESIIYQTQVRLDAFARTRGYDGVLSLCTYATSTVPKFAAEGQYGVEARDATWAKLYEILAEVEAGTRPMPEGYPDIEPELPELAWPDLV